MRHIEDLRFTAKKFTILNYNYQSSRWAMAEKARIIYLNSAYNYIIVKFI